MSSTSKRHAPIDVLYTAVGKYNKNAERILYISTCLGIIISVVDYFKGNEIAKTILIAINSLIIALYAFLDNRASLMFTQAEMKRRLDYLDNSFETNFSGKRSENYFSNDKLNPGLYKLCVNCFENSFHTEFVFRKMFAKILFQAVIVVGLFIGLSFVGQREIIRLFFELVMPLVLIQKLIKAVYFKTRIGFVVENFKTLFNDLMRNGSADKTPEFIRDVLEYETTLSWASIPLASTIFNKYKDQLALEWDDMVKAYKIQN